MFGCCCICHDGFTPLQNISALMCGHVFHQDCIGHWFKQKDVGQSCPICRSKISKKLVVQRLFFDSSGSGGGSGAAGEDAGALNVELVAARSALRDKDASIHQLQQERNKGQEQISALRKTIEVLEKKFQQETVKFSTLKREMQGYRQSLQEADEARAETKELRQKLETLKNLDTLRNGLMSDIEARARGASARDLAEWVVVQESEMKRKRAECRELQEGKERLGRQAKTLQRTCDSLTRDNAALDERVRMLSEDNARLETSNANLRAKLGALVAPGRGEAGSYTAAAATTSGVSKRELFESPAPCPPTKRPRLSDPLLPYVNEGDDAGKHSVLTSPIPAVPSPQLPSIVAAASIKISSAAARKPQAPQLNDISNLSGFNILKKSSGLSGPKSAIRTGYDGMGGHTKFFQAKKSLPTKKTLTKTANGLFAKKTTTATPPLPTLKF